MDFLEQIVPSVIILVANLMSGPHTSLRWETVTAIFGWTGVAGMIALIATSILLGHTVVLHT